MAIKYGFFNSVNGDRKYNADDISNYFLKLISNGVFATPSNSMQVIANNGMTVSVTPGWAFVNCKWLNNDSAHNLTLDAADVVLSRYDRIVIRLNASNAVRNIEIAIKKGTPGSSPIAPTLERVDGGVWELSLATIYVAAGATSITQSAIADNRGDKTLCGYVTGLIDQIDTTNLFAQYNSAFYEWFNDIKTTLTTTTLIRQYTSSYTTTVEGETIIPINILQYNANLDVLNVYINGLKLIQGVDYTKEAKRIILANSLDVVGTSIEFEVLKSIDGSEAESVIDMVYQLQTEVGKLDRNTYICNGVNDNVELMKYIAEWEKGSAQKDRIQIVGTFGVNAETTTASDGKNYSFVYECARGCGMTLDFAQCDAVVANENNFMYLADCTVENLTIMHNNTVNAAERSDIVSNNVILTRCFVHGSFAATATNRIFKPTNSRLTMCDIDVTSTGTVIGITPTASTMTDCEIKIVSNGGEVYGVVCADGSRFDGCEFDVTTTTSGKTARGGYGGGFYSNCVFVATGNNGAHGYYINNTTLFSANNCIFRGYVSNETSGIGTGLTGNSDATALLTGINCNEVAKTGYKQGASMSLTTATGSFTGFFYKEPTVPETFVSYGAFIANKI